MLTLFRSKVSEAHILIYTVLTCPSLPPLSHGKINCSLGEDGEANPGETCTFTCDDGYELSGSASRVCTNSETWSGTTNRCTKGMYIFHSHVCLCIMHD